MHPITTIPALHTEYTGWSADLQFYKDEIHCFERQLEKITNSYPETAVAARAEQFQNRFIREKELIDELRHMLQGHEQKRAALVKELSGLGLQCIHLDNHPALRQEVQTFRRLHEELKTAFRQFKAGRR